MSNKTSCGDSNCGNHCMSLEEYDKRFLSKLIGEAGVALKSKEAEKQELKAIAYHVSNILKILGEDTTRNGLKETPMRVAKMYKEIFRSVKKSDASIASDLLKVFEPDDPKERYGNLVIVKDIPFYSMCEHHLAPFFGTASIGYIPSKDTKVIGISKLARLLEEISKRPQIQERITQSIVDILNRMLSPNGIMVVVKARHMCMEMRGVKKPGAQTVTSAVLGAFENDHLLRNEFLQLIK